MSRDGMHECDAEPPKKAPGSDATTIRVKALLNALPRWLLKVPCSLQRFLRSIVMMPAGPLGRTSLESSTWPMPLPYPEAFSAGGSRDQKAHVKRLVSLQVGVFDWLHLNKPDAAPSCIRLGARLTAKQWSAVRMLEHLSFDGNTPNSVDAEGMGRAAGKVEGLEVALGALSRAVASLQSFPGGYFCGDRARLWRADDDVTFVAVSWLEKFPSLMQQRLNHCCLSGCIFL